MIGTSLGSYRVVRKLGEGGMGVVYEARHEVLGKRVVVKMLRAELSTNPELVNRFFNEARSSAHIKHEGIVEVLDFGRDPHGAAFIVMEYLDGETLGARLRRDGRLAFDLATAIGRQAALAVHAAHALGIIHRDLKPDNLFLVPDRELAFGVRVKVLDFGIAKLLDDGGAVDVHTRTGAVLGTPFYMSPEQCRGAQQIDHRSDVYALGCILYEMVCGFPPFRAAGLGDLIVLHVTEPARPPSTIVAGVPRELEVAILRALAKKPWERQQSAEQLAAELAGARPGDLLATHPAPAAPGAAPREPSLSPTGQPLPPPPLPHLTTGPRAAGAQPGGRRRRPGLAIGIAVTIVAVVASLVTYAVVTARRPAGGSASAGTAAERGGSAAGSATSAGSSEGLPCGAPEACMTAAAALDGAAAIAILDPLCRAGHAPACDRAGVITGGGTGGAADPVRSAVFYQLACDLKDVEGCFRLGVAYHAGEGVTRDAARAVALLEQACTAGVAEACGLLGSDFMDGTGGVAADPARAIAFNEKACDRGMLAACTNLGFQLETGNGAAIDQARAKALYERACGPASPKACENLCMVHVFGKGATKDERAALPQCRRACDLGDMSGCTWTGYLYMKDGGVPVDGEQAVRYFEQACTGGDMKGCFAGGRVLEQGDVIGKDPARARQFYEKACDSGNSPEACTNLAIMVADGRGGKPDLRRALDLFESACGSGDALGCFKAGRFYHFGFKTVARDESMAKQYFDRACKKSAALCDKDPDDP